MNDTNKKANNFLEVIGLSVIAIPLVFIVGILAIMWRTWWLYPAWAWYIEPLGAPHIGFWPFAGISLLVSTMTLGSQSTKKDDRAEDYGKWVAALFWAPTIWMFLWWMHR